ncbi:MAG: hypothetical protein Q3992_04320 [Bacteroides sp.]|nr:hypothetical protein [Bacteroides sp.]
MTQRYTIEEIKYKKALLRNELRQSKKTIAGITSSLFKPSEKTKSTAGSIMQAVNVGFAVFDGFLAGKKLMSRLKNYLTGGN